METEPPTPEAKLEALEAARSTLQRAGLIDTLPKLDEEIAQAKEALKPPGPPEVGDGKAKRILDQAHVHARKTREACKAQQKVVDDLKQRLAAEEIAMQAVTEAADQAERALSIAVAKYHDANTHQPSAQPPAEPVPPTQLYQEWQASVENVLTATESKITKQAVDEAYATEVESARAAGREPVQQYAFFFRTLAKEIAGALVSTIPTSIFVPTEQPEAGRNSANEVEQISQVTTVPGDVRRAARSPSRAASRESSPARSRSREGRREP